MKMNKMSPNEDQYYISNNDVFLIEKNNFLISIAITPIQINIFRVLQRYNEATFHARIAIIYVYFCLFQIQFLKIFTII